MTHTHASFYASALNVLVSVSLEMHAQMELDATQFNMVRFAHQMAESNMILIDVNLYDYEMHLTSALINHPQRVISALMIAKIYRNLFVLQDMAKKAAHS